MKMLYIFVISGRFNQKTALSLAVLFLLTMILGMLQLIHAFSSLWIMSLFILILSTLLRLLASFPFGISLVSFNLIILIGINKLLSEVNLGLSLDIDVS